MMEKTPFPGIVLIEGEPDKKTLDAAQESGDAQP